MLQSTMLTRAELSTRFFIFFAFYIILFREVTTETLVFNNKYAGDNHNSYNKKGAHIKLFFIQARKTIWILCVLYNNGDINARQCFVR